MRTLFFRIGGLLLLCDFFIWLSSSPGSFYAVTKEEFLTILWTGVAFVLPTLFHHIRQMFRSKPDQLDRW